MTMNSDTGDGTKAVYTLTKNAFQEVWAYREPFKEHDLAINVRLLPELANTVSAPRETVGKPGQ